MIMSNFRLRLSFQEFALSPDHPVTVGRSGECHISVDDPLISRLHAQFTVKGSTVVVEDLKSRNGIKVNGKPISDGPCPLNVGDRVRIGTQEFMLMQHHAQAPAETKKITAFMVNCKSCGMPYPETAFACPHCGAQPENEVTLTGEQIGGGDWTLMLLIEIIKKSLEKEKTGEAFRVLSRVIQEMESRTQFGEKLDRQLFDQLVKYGNICAQHPEIGNAHLGTLSQIKSKAKWS